ncbi:MAG: AAA family ATPase, partial [bacterium]|nr:AAA family ATPase [bacterium]
MLKNLHIENFALIDKLEINFEPGLNIITGETGAGKSILIDALGSAIGDKIPADTLRKGATKAVTECLFDLKNVGEIKNFLNQNQFDCGDNDLI